MEERVGRLKIVVFVVKYLSLLYLLTNFVHFHLNLLRINTQRHHYSMLESNEVRQRAYS